MMLEQLLAEVGWSDADRADLDALIPELKRYNTKLHQTTVGAKILQGGDLAKIKWTLGTLEFLNRPLPKSNNETHRHEEFNQRWRVKNILYELTKSALPFTHDQLLVFVQWVAKQDNVYLAYGDTEMIRQLKGYLKKNTLTPALTELIEKRAKRLLGPGRNAAEQKRGQTLREFLGEKAALEIPLRAGDAWADAALATLHALSEEQQTKWAALLAHCASPSGTKPSDKWLKAAQPMLETMGIATFHAMLLQWFPQFETPRTQDPDRPPMRETALWDFDETNANIARGLVWLMGETGEAASARALAKLALAMARKIPSKGVRNLKLLNACIQAMGCMPGTEGVAQLAVLKTRLKLPAVQKTITATMASVARRENLPPDELEELLVPTYGLTAVGVRRETFGDFTAEVVVDGSDVELHWFKPDGKPQASVPQAVKQNFAAELKALKQAATDISKMLPAQRDRLDHLFLAQKKWRLPLWRERYLDQPLMGTLARRLIWKFSADDKAASGIWHDGHIVGRDGAPLDWLSENTQVELWHPLSVEAAAVLEWRAFLQAHEIRQPFKQAHREIYLLTDAERNTHVYSNRFAAHILRQHQFNALCAARGWKNQLRLMVDASYNPAQRTLPQWGLRAEYWIEGIGHDYGTDTNETGTYLYLSTDQVRFYPLTASENWADAYGGGYQRTPGQPIPLEQIPPLVLSEIMRDVDLFVGVASVGNDPTWNDGGPQGRYVDYWQSYSFGALTETAQTRKQVLEGLLPRLKIAKVAHLADKFLVVQGHKRTYKIHLGSGNILMEPNDQYLCIVPARGAASPTTGKVFLPFEGDQTLALILSKAFLLAEDTKITDPTITRQIG